MTEQGQKEFLIETMVSLLKKAIVHQQFVIWLTDVVGVPKGDIDKVLQDIQHELNSDFALPGKLRTVVESSLQSGEATYDSILASALAQWKSKGFLN